MSAAMMLSTSAAAAPRAAVAPRASLRSSFVSGSRAPGAAQVFVSRKAAPVGQSARRVTTMAAKVTKVIKIAIPAGKANPAPPIGPALGAAGVNIMAFCKEYNAATQDKAGTIVPVEISVYEDRSFTFIMKTPPTAELIKKAAGISKGDGMSSAGKAGTITEAQLKEIAEIKMPDLNATTVEAAMRIVDGTAKNMGVTIA